VSGAQTADTPPSIFRTGLILGLLSTLGPLAIDLYLPAFPAIGRELGGTPAEVQRSLSIFFLALAAAQIPWGSLGDRLGRKRPLYAGLVLFLFATAGCALARDTGTLIALRFVQGFGICAATAISRAMIRDLYTGHQAARLLAFSYLIIGISPVLAPSVGSQLLRMFDWRALFWLQAVLGVAGLVLAAFALPESLPRNRRFMAAAAAAGLATTTPFAFLTAAPFVFTAAYGLSPTGYSALLGLAAICSIGTTQVSPNLMRRLGARRHLALTTAAGVALSAILAGLALSNALPLPLFMGLIMALFMIVGLTLTPAAITALDAAEAAGAAAAMLGTLQLAVTAIASAALTVFSAHSAAPLAVLLVAAWLAAALCAHAAFRPQHLRLP
jgi:DHA1 family bicyclomycin/chloramphenicol resistance-like MFS transporter